MFTRTVSLDSKDARFIAFAITFNRSTKEYDVTAHGCQHLALSIGYNCEFSAQGIAAGLGWIIAGSKGPTKPAARAALVNALLEMMSSDRRVDTESFSNPIIIL